MACGASPGFSKQVRSRCVPGRKRELMNCDVCDHMKIFPAWPNVEVPCKADCRNYLNLLTWVFHRSANALGKHKELVPRVCTASPERREITFNFGDLINDLCPSLLKSLTIVTQNTVSIVIVWAPLYNLWYGIEWVATINMHYQVVIEHCCNQSYY